MMETVFMSENGLHQEESLRLLSRKHTEYKIALFESQLKEWKEQERYFPKLSDTEFDSYIDALVAEDFISVEKDPDNIPDTREIIERFGDWNEINPALDRATNAALKFRTGTVLDLINRREYIKAYAGKVLKQIGIIVGAADRMNINPVVVTGRADHPFFCAVGITTIPYEEFLRNSKKTHVKQVRTILSRAAIRDALFILTSVLFAIPFIALIAFMLLLARYVPSAIENAILLLPAWTLAPAFVIGGILLYFWRCVHRMSYGVAEVMVGVVGVYLKVPQLPNRTEIEPWIALMFAIYIIVRGLDNIGQSSKGSKRLMAIWPRIFGPNF